MSLGWVIKEPPGDRWRVVVYASREPLPDGSARRETENPLARLALHSQGRGEEAGGAGSRSALSPNCWSSAGPGCHQPVGDPTGTRCRLQPAQGSASGRSGGAARCGRTGLAS
jgi:hypothetical protein